MAKGLSATVGSNSALPHRCREGCNFSFTERLKSPRDALPQELAHLDGPNFLGIKLLLVIHDAVFWDVGGDFLSFRQRTDPLLIIEPFPGWAKAMLHRPRQKK